MKRSVSVTLLLFCLSAWVEGAKPSYKYTFKMIKPAESTNGLFTDKYIQAAFPLNRIEFSFTIKNITDQPIFLDWNQASYVDPAGQSHKVIHTGIRYIERDKEMPPSIIPPGASLSDIFYPADYVNYSRGFLGTGTGRWETQQMLPKPEQGRHLIGKTISLFIPLKINGEQKYYSFVFQLGIEEQVK